MHLFMVESKKPFLVTKEFIKRTGRRDGSIPAVSSFSKYDLKGNPIREFDQSIIRGTNRKSELKMPVNMAMQEPWPTEHRVTIFHI